MKLVKINEDNCVYCHLCEVACKAEHSASKDIIKAVKKENVLSRCTAEFNYPYSASIMCRHCDDAPCVFACQNGSMHKNDKGYVVVNPDTCVGCWMCIMVCPYGVIKQGKREDFGLSIKCDLCPDRSTPACVEACPNEALTFEEL